MRSSIVCTAFASVFVLVALPGAASAHHGGAVEWGSETLGPISGTAVEFAFRFPHVQVLVDVTDASGTTVQWTLVTRWTPTILRQHGWTRDSIKPGDSLTVTYLPHVESATVGSIQSIEVNDEALEISF
jgi:hypothetical protein